jgi:MacB-like periplasmic core domain
MCIIGELGGRRACRLDPRCKLLTRRGAGLLGPFAISVRPRRVGHVFVIPALLPLLCACSLSILSSFSGCGACETAALERGCAFIQDGSGDSRQTLMVRALRSDQEALPVSYGRALREIPGVASVAMQTSFCGVLRGQDTKMITFYQDAVDDEYLKTHYRKLIAGSYADYVKRRDGCIVGEYIAKALHLKIGDTVSLLSWRFPLRSGVAWTFRVSAICRFSLSEEPSNSILHRNIADDSMYLHIGFLESVCNAHEASGVFGIDKYWLYLGAASKIELVARSIVDAFKITNQPVEVVDMTVREDASIGGRVPLRSWR